MQRRSTRKPDSTGPKPVRRRPARLDRSIQNEIGRNLRAMYNDVVEQGVPDRFADLLAQLDQLSPPDKPSRKPE
jgi:hypothetical protein